MTIERTSWDDPRAAALRAAMDLEIMPRYALRDVSGSEAERAATARALTIDPATLEAVLLALEADGTPVGHAALRRLDVDGAEEHELKRVIVLPPARGRGGATALVRAVEAVAAAAGAHRLILHTGDQQPEAVALYERLGYHRIPVYAPYAGTIPGSLCFARDLDGDLDPSALGALRD